jgi:hypothetical protein
MVSTNRRLKVQANPEKKIKMLSQKRKETGLVVWLKW